jgi:protein-S-isoprenylcysteine O-methyltransferase Ste14
MGASWRIGVDPGERTALVTQGIFGRVRNPIFSAMLLAAVGLVLLVPNVLSAVALVLLIVGLELQVRLVEEPYLTQVHGEPYRRYLASAGRFVPGVGLRRA